MRVRSAWGVTTLLACSVVTPASAPVSAPAVPDVASAPVMAPVQPDPTAQLAARGVRRDDFARAVLYSWTTPTQVAALRDTPTLLVADAGVGLPSPFLRGLGGVVQRREPGHALAAILLDDPRLRRRRYAWPSPFATTMGLGPVRYGDALIRVELDPRAIVVRFAPGDTEPFAAVDMRGAAVPIEAIDPARIAAVYHVRDGPREVLAFREYVLCNESMIARWSVATPEIRAQVDADIELLTALADGPLVGLPEVAVRSSAAPAWSRGGDTPIDLWHASLAFDNVRYRPSRRNLAAIVAALREYDDTGPPLVGAHTAQSAQTAR